GKSKAAVLRLPKTAPGAPAPAAAAPPRPPGTPPPAPGKPPPPGGPRPAAKNDDRTEHFYDLKTRIHRKLVETLDLTPLNQREGEVRAEVREVVAALCEQENALLNLNDRQQLIEEILNETFGLGPLETLLADPHISDILINGPKQVYIERKGRLELTPVRFKDNPHLLHVIDKICSSIGRRCDEVSPMVDARLKD